MSDLQIDLHNESLILLPERAIYWPRLNTLFVADAHWGKAAAFRAAAMAIPESSEDDRARLDQIIARTNARQLILLGDLLHTKASRAQSTIETFSAWRATHPNLEIVLVRGNHDERAGDPPSEWRMTCVDAPHLIAPFALQHHPTPSPEGYTLAGHLHPGAVLNGAGRQTIKLPCFWFGAHVAVLPAFGSFTGTAAIRPRLGDRVFVVAGDEVIGV